MYQTEFRLVQFVKRKVSTITYSFEFKKNHKFTFVCARLLHISSYTIPTIFYSSNIRKFYHVSNVFQIYFKATMFYFSLNIRKKFVSCFEHVSDIFQSSHVSFSSNIIKNLYNVSDVFQIYSKVTVCFFVKY